MNIWQHCLLSVRKFGGIPEDYEAIHSFMDFSKYFFYHAKHRLLMHHLLGVEYAVEVFGNFIQNSDGNKVLVRDVAVEHCAEDLDGRVPTLSEWLNGSPDFTFLQKSIPDLHATPNLFEFVWKPFWRTGQSSSLILTFSDFGIFLASKLLTQQETMQLARIVPEKCKVKYFLQNFRLSATWQYTPQKHELEWLKSKENEKRKKVLEKQQFDSRSSKDPVSKNSYKSEVGLWQ